MEIPVDQCLIVRVNMQREAIFVCEHELISISAMVFAKEPLQQG